MKPKQFKGWTVPGVILDHARAEDLPADGETLDALSGDFRIFQLREGHRFSTDDLLAAWYGTQCSASVRTALDLGSGIGSVGMIAAWRLPGARFVTVEAQAGSVALARRSARYNGLEGRYEIRHGDFREREGVAGSVLSESERFDLVLGSPPYFPEESGLHGDHPQKVACRFEQRGTVADYCATASRHLAPGGVFACVFPVSPPHQREKILAGARESGLVIARHRPVCLREGDQPLLGVFAMWRREDLPERYAAGASSGEPLWTEPVLTIRAHSGAVSGEYSAIKLSIGFPP